MRIALFWLPPCDTFTAIATSCKHPNHRYRIGESSVYHCQKSKQLLFSLSMKPGKWQNPSRCRCPSSDDVGLRTNGDITACAVTRSDSVATSCANPELDQRCGPSKMSSRSPLTQKSSAAIVGFTWPTKFGAAIGHIDFIAIIAIALKVFSNEFCRRSLGHARQGRMPDNRCTLQALGYLVMNPHVNNGWKTPLFR